MRELISRLTNDTNLLRFSSTQLLTGVGRALLSVIGLTARRSLRTGSLSAFNTVSVLFGWTPKRNI